VFALKAEMQVELEKHSKIFAKATEFTNFKSLLGAKIKDLTKD